MCVGGRTAQHNVLKTNFEAVTKDLNSLKWDEILRSDFHNDYNSVFDTLQKLLEKYSLLLTLPYKKKNIYMSKESIRLKNAKKRLWERCDHKNEIRQR